MTSELAKRLTQDLLQVGRKFGFETSKEEEILPGSDFKVDVFWSIPMPDTTYFSSVNVACIEIQYSKSLASITHNLRKSEVTLHPAIHFVISYNKIPEDEIIVLRRDVPAGLVIIDGEEEVRELNLWITRFLTLKTEEAKIESTGKKIITFLEKHKTEKSEIKLAENIRNEFAKEIEDVFIPPEVSSLLNFSSSNSSYNRQVLNEVFYAFVSFVKSELEKYKITEIAIPAQYLFPNGYNIEESFRGRLELEEYIIITQNGVFVRTGARNGLRIAFNNGLVSISSDSGIVCEDSLTTADFFKFIVLASQIVESTLKKYEITPEDDETLRAIKEAFYRR